MSGKLDENKEIKKNESAKDRKLVWNKIGEFFTKQGLLVAFIITLIVFSFLSPYFLQTSNFINISLALAIILMLAAGETVTLICGLPDLSVGSALAFSGMITALLIANNINFILAIIAGILTGAFIGLLNGIITTKLKVNPLITTLGTLAAFRGLSFIINDGKAVNFENNLFDHLGRGKLLGIPIPFIVALFVCFFIYYILNFTVFGRRMRAVGGGSDISKLFGINVDRIKIMAFVISGITAGIAGVIITAKMKAGVPIAGKGIELAVISAVILGGTSLTGGIGNIWGTFLGVVFLATLQNGFTLTYVSSYWQDVVRGLVLIGAVTLDVMRREKRRR